MEAGGGGAAAGVGLNADVLPRPSCTPRCTEMGLDKWRKEGPMLFSRTWEDCVYFPVQEDEIFAPFLLDFICFGIKLDPKVRLKNG